MRQCAEKSAPRCGGTGLLSRLSKCRLRQSRARTQIPEAVQLRANKAPIGEVLRSGGLFKQSLAIEEKLSIPSDVKIGRRLVELSVSLAGQDKWTEGSHYLARAIPISNQFRGA